ncbi:MAG: asparagine synthase (glutamine-hydrolyzing) [Deltaproteobacteria bacterium]|nr:asparagine synthase (glutamine-hydrolyzing) [Deltaproteobacteria bacterium]
MCGLCGMLQLNGAPVDQGLLRRMTAVLSHRGPDDEGFLVENGLGLGFRRLSIIDLPGGRQPMSNEDQTVTVVFNGEIYNFVELRADLKQQGHVFRTSSDTEVIVHGFEAWGDDVVHHLNGMFAFAVWDRRRQKLLLARDRLGIKPLFYTRKSDTLAFASEIKSLLLLPGFDPAVSDGGVFEYFSHHFIPGSGTIYQNIQKLTPGELLTVADGEVKTRKYWRPAVTSDPERTLEDWCRELRQRLREAVRLQLVADVPLGVFLSGGLDSSAVTAAMAGLGAKEIRTFSVGFEAPKYDETRFAQLVSQHLGTVHETFRITAEATDLLPKLLWHLDEPLADATIIPTYLLSKATRRQVTVALSGEGGDELFGGYTHYQGMQLNRWLSVLPLWCRRTLAATARHLPTWGSPRLGYLEHRLERIAATSLLPLFEGYTRKVAFFSPEAQQRLFSPDFQRRIADLPYLQHFWAVPQAYPDLDPIAQANLADLSVFLPDSLLVKVDRMSMACSLEVRVPLLDHTLVEFALSIPMDLKVSGMHTKHLLREAVAPWLPQAIVNRPKRGFNPPVEFWLQHHLVDYAREYHLMETLAATGYFNLATVQEMAEAHIQGRRDFSRQIWALLVFAIWWRRVRGRGEWQP